MCGRRGAISFSPGPPYFHLDENEFPGGPGLNAPHLQLTVGPGASVGIILKTPKECRRSGPFPHHGGCLFARPVQKRPVPRAANKKSLRPSELAPALGPENFNFYLSHVTFPFWFPAKAREFGGVPRRLCC